MGINPNLLAPKKTRPVIPEITRDGDMATIRGTFDLPLLKDMVFPVFAKVTFDRPNAPATAEKLYQDIVPLQKELTSLFAPIETNFKTTNNDPACRVIVTSDANNLFNTHRSIPYDIVLEILHLFDKNELLQCRCISRRWRNLLNQRYKVPSALFHLTFAFAPYYSSKGQCAFANQYKTVSSNLDTLTVRIGLSAIKPVLIPFKEEIEEKMMIIRQCFDRLIPYTDILADYLGEPFMKATIRDKSAFWRIMRPVNPWPGYYYSGWNLLHPSAKYGDIYRVESSTDYYLRDHVGDFKRLHLPTSKLQDKIVEWLNTNPVPDFGTGNQRYDNAVGNYQKRELAMDKAFRLRFRLQETFLTFQLQKLFQFKPSGEPQRLNQFPVNHITDYSDRVTFAHPDAIPGYLDGMSFYTRIGDTCDDFLQDLDQLLDQIIEKIHTRMNLEGRETFEADLETLNKWKNEFTERYNPERPGYLIQAAEIFNNLVPNTSRVAVESLVSPPLKVKRTLDLECDEEMDSVVQGDDTMGASIIEADPELTEKWESEDVHDWIFGGAVYGVMN